MLHEECTSTVKINPNTLESTESIDCRVASLFTFDPKDVQNRKMPAKQLSESLQRYHTAKMHTMCLRIDELLNEDDNGERAKLITNERIKNERREGVMNFALFGASKKNNERVKRAVM